MTPNDTEVFHAALERSYRILARRNRSRVPGSNGMTRIDDERVNRLVVRPVTVPKGAGAICYLSR